MLISTIATRGNLSSLLYVITFKLIHHCGLMWHHLILQKCNKYIFLSRHLTIVPTDFIIRNERQCNSSEWIIDYWAVSAGAQASHYAYCWTQRAHVPAHIGCAHTNTRIPIKAHTENIKLLSVQAQRGVFSPFHLLRCHTVAQAACVGVCVHVFRRVGLVPVALRFIVPINLSQTASLL